jgi:hypothetical protein
VSSFAVTPIVRPPPFVVTNDRNPKSSPGVSHPLVMRTITPPPYPYSFSATPTTITTSSSSSDVVPVVFPRVTYKPGPPGPICRSGCGKPCLLFCNAPCLRDCIDGGLDFADPCNPRRRRRR